MRRAPHFALRGLYRRAGAAIGIAARFDEGKSVPKILLAELSHHPLVAPAALEKLAIGVDAATPLERALARIARKKPERAAAGRTRMRRADRLSRIRGGGGVTPEREETSADREGAKRVAEILSAASSVTSSADEDGWRATQRRSRRGLQSRGAEMSERRLSQAEEEPTASSRETAITPKAARAAFDRWIDRIGPGSERPVAAVPATEAIGELVAGRTISTASLNAAANPSDAPDEPGEISDSPLAQSEFLLAAALDRIDARRASLRARRAAGARADFSEQSSEPASTTDHRLIDDAGGRVSGLRRLAVRAGAEIRSSTDDAEYEPAPWARRERGEVQAGSIALLPEPDDDTLARRIADILAREARRHGVETGAIEP
ncbi:MAG: hypothetical protein ACRED5_05405 [Propylenella sp.]